MSVLDSVVIGAGQAGVSASYHLKSRGVDHLVLDANDRAGGAWQHRWDSLTMADVHGVAALPDSAPPPLSDERANVAVARYFAAYEEEHDLPIVRPVLVDAVTSDGDLLVVHGSERTWVTRTLVNATGTWRQPFVPHYPGMAAFLGEQLHTVDYPGADLFVGRRVLVVGGGASAVQLLGELALVTDTLWVTRRAPVWRTGEFDREAGHTAVSLVEERVRRGLPPASVVSVTGLALREQERAAEALGAYERRPMFDRIEPDGVRWAEPPAGRPAFERVDVILWATGFRPAVSHLAPLHLRSPHGGIQLTTTAGTGPAAATTAVADPRVQLVGYGPSASTIGANRAGRAAAIAVRRHLGRGVSVPSTAP
jgi:cation diffusion facilitator CzcD-associated flavoprotein CzcO